MPVRPEQLHAKAVNCSEKRTAECLDHLGFFRQICILQNLLSGALLHFIRGTVRVGDYDKLRQPFQRLPAPGDFNDPISNRTRLARASRGNYREILVQLTREPLASVSVNEATHERAS